MHHIGAQQQRSRTSRFRSWPPRPSNEYAQSHVGAADSFHPGGVSLLLSLSDVPQGSILERAVPPLTTGRKHESRPLRSENLLSAMPPHASNSLISSPHMDQPPSCKICNTLTACPFASSRFP